MRSWWDSDVLSGHGYKMQPFGGRHSSVLNADSPVVGSLYAFPKRARPRKLLFPKLIISNVSSGLSGFTKYLCGLRTALLPLQDLPGSRLVRIQSVMVAAQDLSYR